MAAPTLTGSAADDLAGRQSTAKIATIRVVMRRYLFIVYPSSIEENKKAAVFRGLETKKPRALFRSARGSISQKFMS
jgi:hypothetical protein